MHFVCISNRMDPEKKLLCSRFNRDSENEANGIEIRDVGNRADEETEINPQR